MSGRTRFRALEALYHRLSEAAPNEREALLAEIRGTDPDLAVEAERLLARDGDADHALLLGAAADSPPAPERVGPYRIGRVLGEGGMGVVYEGHQEAPIRRRAAVKLIHSALRGQTVLARFQLERQTLALMSHPGIARVYDAGEASDGTPYVAMELVDGRPITEYCAQHRLSLPARLTLFVRVCEAVRYAHRQGIIHRDLKPSNILVAEENAQAAPKIIDFGIAKLLSDDEGVQAKTSAGDVLGTLHYMSPEQIRGAPVDTRSDVYSLGVVLYELLTDVLPFNRRDQGEELETFRRRVLEQSPMPPRRRARAAGDGAAPEGRRAALTRDLDIIALKALEKDPNRRYGSAEELGADVGRYLENRPILARPDSLLYRMGKYYRRNPAAAVAATALVLALIGGGALSTVAFLKADAERLVAERAVIEAQASKLRAEEEARKATAVADFLEDLFRAGNPAFSGTGPPSFEDFLRAGVEKIESEFSDQPEIRAQMLSTMGDAYFAMARNDTAEALLKDAAAAAKQAGETLLAVRVLRRLSLLRASDDDLDQAAAYLNEAFALLPAGDDRDTELLRSDLLAAMSWNAYKLGQAPAQLEYMVQSAELRRRWLAPDAVGLANAYSMLASAHYAQGAQNYAEAEAEFSRALDIYTAGGHLDHAYQATLGNFAALLIDARKPEQAIATVSEALEASRRLFGEEHPRTATALKTLGVAQQVAGQFDAAQRSLDQSLSLREQALGDHTETASSLLALADLHRTLGNLDQAASLLERADGMQRQLLPDGHVKRREAAYLRGAIASRRHDYAAALTAFSAALAGSDPAVDGLSPLSANIEVERALALIGQGRPDQALAAARAGRGGWRVMASDSADAVRAEWVYALAANGDIVGSPRVSDAPGLSPFEKSFLLSFSNQSKR